MRAKRASELRYVCNFTDNFQTLHSDYELGCCVGSCVVCVACWGVGRAGIRECGLGGCWGVCVWGVGVCVWGLWGCVGCEWRGSLGRESIARSALLSGYLGKSGHLPR